MTFTFTYW